MWALPELIEAAVRSGNPTVAGDALTGLTAAIWAGGTDFGLGMQARSHALLTEGACAESLYREAVDRLGRTQLRPELARAHLLYGEWLRRENRRVDARAQLRTAHELLSGLGMMAFSERPAANCGPRARRSASAPSRPSACLPPRRPLPPAWPATGDQP
jgi:hypothetical protein